MTDVASTGQNTKTYTLNSAASTNAAVVKGAAGNLHNVHVSNQHATQTYFLKFFDKATAPTVGTDRPVVIVPVVALNQTTIQLGGLRFSNGISICIVTTAPDAGSTGCGVNEVKVAATYA